MIFSRFPVVSAFNVTWDSSKPPGQRLLNICLNSPSSENGINQVKSERGKFYNIVTREYMAQVSSVC